MKITAHKRVSLPEKWVQFYKVILCQKKKFLKLTELQQLFKALYVKHLQILQPSQIMKKFTLALEYYRAAGHVLYYPDNDVLIDYVFHNKDFILDLLKSCFHHNLKEATDFSALEQTTPALHIELMMKQYEQEGLLAIELLRFLWRQYGLEEQEEAAVLEVMKKFHLCYEVDACKKVYFMPWFIERNKAPTALDLGKLHTINQQYFSALLDCVFHNNIPINAFEVMQVQVQKTAVEKKYGGSRYAWRDGIQVKIGTLEIRAVRNTETSTISLCVCGPISDVPQVWQVTSDIYVDLESILQPLLGVIKLIYFKCTHCIVKGLYPVTQRLPSEVLKNQGLDVTYDCCKGDKIPRALVIAPSGESENKLNVLNKKCN